MGNLVRVQYEAALENFSKHAVVRNPALCWKGRYEDLSVGEAITRLLSLDRSKVFYLHFDKRVDYVGDPQVGYTRVITYDPGRERDYPNDVVVDSYRVSDILWDIITEYASELTFEYTANAFEDHLNGIEPVGMIPCGNTKMLVESDMYHEEWSITLYGKNEDTSIDVYSLQTAKAIAMLPFTMERKHAYEATKALIVALDLLQQMGVWL